MQRLNRIMMICSLVASIVCLVLSVGLIFYTRDKFFIFAAILFLVATVWTGVNVKKLLQQDKDKK